MMHAMAAVGIPVPLETPLLKIGLVWLKPELWQWTGSVKYRMVYAKVQKALEKGLIGPDTTLVEVTSGSTGAALAYVGRLLGIPVELHAYTSITPKKRAQIEDSGAKLILHPVETPITRLLEAVNAKVKAGGYWHLGQYDRQSTMVAYEDLGKELVGQLLQAEAIPPKVFLCPVGTGGLIQGLGIVLKKAFPGIRVVAVEPASGEAIEGARNTERFHLGADDPYDRSFPDETIRVARPERTSVIGKICLGESASAAYELAQAREWGTTIIVAPD